MASFQSPKRILVTGGTGFIGQHVVANLKAKGHYPVILDRHYLPRDPTTETVMGSVTDRSAVDHAVSICDGVIHLAAVLGTQETIEEPGIAFEVNVRGSINVFQAVRHYGVPAVYITVGNYWMNNPYSISKHTAERLALMFNKECGTRIAVVRGYNAYGPGQKAAPVRKIIPNFIIPALKGEELIVYGDGTQIMDMIYVEDIAEILVQSLLTDRGWTGTMEGYEEIVEAGTGRATTVHQIAQMVIGKVGRGQIRLTPMRPGEPEQSVVLATPHSRNFVSLEDGLDRTIPYYAEALKTADYI